MKSPSRGFEAWFGSQRLFWVAGFVLLGGLLLLMQGLVGQSLRLWEQRFGDFIWRSTAERSLERRVVVIDIDERSLAEIGPWPWSREVQARLMDQLAAQGVRQQVWDVVFASGGSAAANEALARAIDRHRPVLAQILGLPVEEAGSGPQSREGRLAGALPWNGCPEPFAAAQATGYLANHPTVLQRVGAQAAVGHITPRLAPDGVLRQQPAVICAEGRPYAALALVAMGHSMGSQNWSLERGGWGQAPWTMSLWPAGQRPDAASGPALLRVPLEANGDLAVAWQRHPESWLSLSASDVLAGRVPGGMLQGAWVVVGGSAFGLNDRIATPLQSSASGFLAHAQLMVNLLDDQLPARPQPGRGLEAALAFGVLLVLTGVQLLARRRRVPRRGGAPVESRSGGASLVSAWWAPLGLLSVPVLFLAHGALLRAGVVIGWLGPAVAVSLTVLVMGAWSHARSRVERERLFGHLSSYLPAPVAQVLAGRSRSNRIEASAQRRVVVMFADIRNFSAYCEARPPAEAAAVLHAFYTAAHRTVTERGGVLESLQGDCIIAAWYEDDQGAPPAARALGAARALLHAMDGVLPDPAPAGLEPLALGLGLECGPAMSGSIGPAERRTHLVMGRTVTIAGRLVEMTAELAHPILVGEGLAAQLGGEHGGQRLRSLGTFMLEGLRVPHHVYAWVAEQPAPLAVASAPEGEGYPNDATPRTRPNAGTAPAQDQAPFRLH